MAKKTKESKSTTTRTRGVNTRGWTCVQVTTDDNETLEGLCVKLTKDVGKRITRKHVVGLAVARLAVEVSEDGKGIVETLTQMTA